MSPYLVKDIWSNTAQLEEDGNDNIVSTDQLSITKRKNGLTKHRENDNNMMDATADHMTKLDPTQSAEQVPQIKLNNMNADGDVSPTETSQSKAVEYIVDEIVVHNDANFKMLYCASW